MVPGRPQRAGSNPFEEAVLAAGVLAAGTIHISFLEDEGLRAAISLLIR
jgi:hypothetical protein